MRRLRIRRDHQDGVVSGYRSHHFGPFFLIQGGGQGAGISRQRFQHQQILGDAYILKKVRQDDAQVGTGLLWRKLSSGWR